MSDPIFASLAAAWAVKRLAYQAREDEARERARVAMAALTPRQRDRIAELSVYLGYELTPWQALSLSRALLAMRPASPEHDWPVVDGVVGPATRAASNRAQRRAARRGVRGGLRADAVVLDEWANYCKPQECRPQALSDDTVKSILILAGAMLFLVLAAIYGLTT